MSKKLDTTYCCNATLWDELNIKNDYLNAILAAAFLANIFIPENTLVRYNFTRMLTIFIFLAYYAHYKYMSVWLTQNYFSVYIYIMIKQG